jgi:Holliday junction resolvasome RuvABC endonuclease subunit
MIALGLDISTSCIGWSIIDYENNTFKLIDIGYFEPLKSVSSKKKLKDLSSLEFLDMLQLTNVFIDNILAKYTPNKIFIEDYIRYMAGGSGAGTIIPLACLNRAICLLCYKYMNFNKDNITVCNVMSIRACIKKSASLEDFPKKEQLHPILEKLMNIILPIVYEQKKKKQVISSFTYDQSDSIACIYYGIMKQNGS